MKNLSIGKKIYLAFAIITLAAVITGVFISNQMSVIYKNVNKIAKEDLVTIENAILLEEQIIEFVDNVNGIYTVSKKENLDETITNILTDISAIGTLIATIPMGEAETSSLNDLVEKIKTKTAEVQQKITQKISDLNTLSQKQKSLLETNAQLIKIIAPIYDNAEFEFVMGLEDIKGDSTKLTPSSSSALESNVVLATSALNFKADVNILNGILSEILQTGDATVLVPLQEKANGTIANLNKVLGKFDEENKKAIAEQLSVLENAITGKENIVTLRRNYLQNVEDVYVATGEIGAYVVQLKNTLSATVQSIQSESKNSMDVVLLKTTTAGTFTAISIVISFILSLVICVWFVRPKIVNRLINVYQATTEIALGNLDIDIHKSGNDELSKMADALLLFKNNELKRLALVNEQKHSVEQQEKQRRNDMLKMADNFETSVGMVIENLAAAAQKIQSQASQLSHVMNETSANSSAVSSAAEQASENVSMVAAATEEMNASVSGINENVNDTSRTVAECSKIAKVSQDNLDQLQAAVNEIGAVIQSINDVAEQTNLLALNATIEAARAGDAGKGFAVVANEVKALAGQTHNMTSQISERVNHVKFTADETISSVTRILNEISVVSEKTGMVAEAINMLRTTTVEISSNVQQASKSTTSVSTNIQEIQRAANESAYATEQLNQASIDLAELSVEHQDSMAQFLDQIRAGGSSGSSAG